ncbi:C6 zinc finger domain containing protein [Pyrenophora tritici-repentis Pt-1C-BFP]|uniref:C6 zinc finger domain containing protein n=1 Tax=Pyrenophora tritici-repentis (strain Pt-1C-BFP) TaxID=426418 RepID=B2WA56_PYRTR|nr:C6 zinc finger domain containing protein [Pyrenophora tritici-repentis Pt-1C-BFP]EDU50088.1 C6 zinc finger domain containing protein [Pyrenophora tritici-repentis Pt-1C-BFP]
MRSRTGCLTCRQRKLKCDEKKPVCGQCTKASRECVPSSGIVFRHQHNASMNGEDLGDENSLKGFYAYKNTFDDNAIWMDIPKNVTFINTTNPYLDPGTPDFDSMSAASDSPGPFEARSVASWRTHSNFQSVTSTPSSMGPDLGHTSVPYCYTPDLESLPPLMQSPPTSAVGTPISPPLSLCNRRMHPVIDYAASTASPPIDPRLNSPYDSADHIPRSVSISSSRRSPPRSDGGTPTQDDHEIAFLLRWFSEGPGYWMDLFDLGTYFASYVPVKARENPLLKYAAVACAAKALARVQGRKPVMGGSVTRQARMEQYPDAPLVDWKHKAAVYYDTAVTLLLHALKMDVASSPDGSECELRRQSHDFVQGYPGPTHKRRRTSSNTSFVSSTDEILAASAILCVYEFLDTSVSEWAKHLNGAKSLLVLSQEHVMPFQLPTPPSSIPSASFNFTSKARRATFWNIARQDMLAAFINKTRTRLDTDCLALWKEAGLLIDEQGYIMPSNTTASGYPEEGEAMMKEDLICNALVWLMAKLVNFMAAGDEISNAAGVSWANVPQRTLLDYWFNLRKQFQVWHDGLPVTFNPSARVTPSHTPIQIHNCDDASLFTEVWYSIPMCASTMQTYHMSQILLFMNKPHESTQGGSTVVARMNSYQSVLATCQKHSPIPESARWYYTCYGTLSLTLAGLRTIEYDNFSNSGKAKKQTALCHEHTNLGITTLEKCRYETAIQE